MLEMVIASNGATEAEHRVLAEGMMINNRMVRRFTRVSERVIGDTYASWIVLLEGTHDDFHRFVVWRVIARPAGWSCESGDYTHTWEEGVEAYEARGGE